MSPTAKKRASKKIAAPEVEAEPELSPEPEALPEEPEAESAEAVKFAPVRREERLQKIIAAAGVTSRRKAEELITEGRVQVNGQTVVELGAKADGALDHIRVDGKLLAKPGQGTNRLRYAVLNKPKGYITSASDPEGRPTVMKFFPGQPRVFPVGRLDYQSEGLLLMTNDGDLAHLLTRAANKVPKVYLVKISRKPSDEAINQLRAGIMIDKGRTKEEKLGRVLTQPAGIRCIRDAENPWYEVTLTEGRNREIRKMFEEVGHFVEKIRRVGYGPLVLDVEPGEVRELNPDEVLQLQRAARGIRTRSSVTVPPISVPPIRHKAKRGTGIGRQGSSDPAKPMRQPVLSEWPTKPARPPAIRPAADERPPSTRTSATAGKSFTTNRPSVDRPGNGYTSSDRPSSNRSNRPVSDRANNSRSASNRPPNPRATGDRPKTARPTGTERPSRRPQSSSPRTFSPKSPARKSLTPRPFAPESFETRAPRNSPLPSLPPDIPETPSLGITITREPASRGKSFNERPGTGRPKSGSPFGARRPGTGGSPNRAGSGSATGYKGKTGRPQGQAKTRPKSGPRNSR
jgi:23S rRNA pseudouridine2605 synthase